MIRCTWNTFSTMPGLTYHCLNVQTFAKWLDKAAHGITRQPIHHQLDLFLAFFGPPHEICSYHTAGIGGILGWVATKRHRSADALFYMPSRMQQQDESGLLYAAPARGITSIQQYRLSQMIAVVLDRMNSAPSYVPKPLPIKINQIRSIEQKSVLKLK